jgi:glutathione S-transferase
MSSEVHKSFEPLFVGRSAEAMASARRVIAHRLALLAEPPTGPYLFGPRPSVADCYLFVMLLWATRFGIAVPETLVVLRDSMLDRPVEYIMREVPWGWLLYSRIDHVKLVPERLSGLDPSRVR